MMLVLYRHDDDIMMMEKMTSTTTNLQEFVQRVRMCMWGGGFSACVIHEPGVSVLLFFYADTESKLMECFCKACSIMPTQ